MPSVPSPPSRWSRLRRGRRAALLCSVAGGLLVPVYYLLVADVSHLAWDFRAYHAAATAFLAGDPFVGTSPGLPGVRYVYPPTSVLLFVPQAAVGGWRAAFAVQAVVNAAAMLGVAALTVWTVEAARGRLPTADRLLVAGFCLGSAPAAAVLGLGQVDALVALALAGAFVALERDREGVAGAALAAAALVKVFPAALGLWLVCRRAWRALAAAVATGVAGLAVGLLWFGPGAYRRYLSVVADRSRVAEFAGTVSPDFFAMTLYRPLSQLLPAADPRVYAPLSVAVLAPAVALVAARQRTLVDRLAAYLVAVAAVVLVSPASNSLYVVYVYFPLLCLLFLSARRRALLLAGTAAVAFPVQPAHVDAAFSTVGAPATVSSPLLAVVRPALTVASVPLVGLLALVAWCTLRSVGRSPSAAEDPQPVRAD